MFFIAFTRSHEVWIILVQRSKPHTALTFDLIMWNRLNDFVESLIISAWLWGFIPGLQQMCTDRRSVRSVDSWVMLVVWASKQPHSISISLCQSEKSFRSLQHFSRSDSQLLSLSRLSCRSSLLLYHLSSLCLPSHYNTDYSLSSANTKLPSFTVADITGSAEAWISHFSVCLRGSIFIYYCSR